MACDLTVPAESKGRKVGTVKDVQIDALYTNASGSACRRFFKVLQVIPYVQVAVIVPQSVSIFQDQTSVQVTVAATIGKDLLYQNEKHTLLLVISNNPVYPCPPVHSTYLFTTCVGLDHG